MKILNRNTQKLLALLILSLPLSLAFGQSYDLNDRSVKSTTGKTPTFQYEQITYNQKAQDQVRPLERVILSNSKNTISPRPVHVLKGTLNSLGKTSSPSSEVLAFISTQTSGIQSPEKELVAVKTESDILASIITFTRKLKNIDVFGGELKSVIKSNGEVIVTGSFLPTPANTDLLPMPSTKAESKALKAIGETETISIFDDRWKLSFGQGVQSNLYWASVDDASLQLVYIVDYFPNHIHWHRVWVDAITGEILRKYTKTCSVDGPKSATATDLNNQSRTVNTYQIGSTYYMIDASRSMFSSSRSKLPDDPSGAIWTIDAAGSDGSDLNHVTSSNNTWSDKAAVSAHYNAGLAYNYFTSTHGRNSINGSGGTIISVVNVTENGSGLDNAYWNGQAMFYGNGRTAFKPLAGSLDVAGHELTHGVVSSTANLEYYSQPGAINESMADVFGVMIDRDDWQLGEDVVKTSVFTSGALRDMSDPHNGGSNLNHNGYQPEKMSEYYTGDDDNQGVHINSGIVNHAFYIYATSIGKDKAEKIYYRALTTYLTSSSKFLDLRYAIVQSAEDLYGSSSNEVNKAKDAFDAVEIYDPNAGSGGGGGQDDLPTNSGDEFVLSVDVNVSDANTLYRSSTTGENFIPLSQTEFIRRPSVVDDGSYCIFVAGDNNIRSITLKGTLAETALTSDAFWDNCAISRDGNRLAGVSTEIDSAIYVYDFVTEKWGKFDLYNPTFSSGINSGGVLYADAIEFDYSGEYILYDAYNQFKSATGAELEYWDIGVIRVWDNEKDAWGDGKVEKLFSQLPDDVSVGNPTYSKNSPYIIAFDYIDDFESEYAVLALNTETGKVGIIYENNRLGYPNYSNDDEQILFDATSSGDPVVGVRSLDSDKITGTGTASLLISDAQWGIWYADGSRSLLSDKKELLSFSFPGLEGGPTANISGTNVTITLKAGTDVTMLIPTFTNSSLSSVSIGSTEQFSGVTVNNFSNPVTYRVTAEDGSTQDYKVTVSVEVVGIDRILSNTPELFPNPVNSTFTIRNLTHPVRYQIVSIDGKVVESGIYHENTDLNVSHLEVGLYRIQLQTGKGLSILSFIKN